MNNVTGIILCGGKSRRFKSPKYQAKINEKTLLEIAIEKLKPLCDELIVVSKEKLDIQAKNIIEKDSDYHPLIGITEGLKASSNDANLVVACDMPFVSKKVLAPLLKSKADIIIYRYKGKAEPLLGMYRKSCLQNIADFKDKRIIDVIEECDFQYIDEENDNLAFMNINTKEDLDEARKIAGDNPEILSN